jgi:cell wall-associated NlpC family hydrolase
MWDRFVGLPYRDGGRDFDGVDCWGLVWLAHREERGIVLPSFHDRYTLPADRKVIGNIVAGVLDAFDDIAPGAEQPFDQVLMRDAGRLCHVGMVIGAGRLLHIERGETSRIESYRGGRIKGRIAGIYRFKG